MHTINLGLGQTLLGSAFRLMADLKVWGPGSEDDQLKIAFSDFDTWAKAHRIPRPACMITHVLVCIQALAACVSIRVTASRISS